MRGRSRGRYKNAGIETWRCHVSTSEIPVLGTYGEGTVVLISLETTLSTFVLVTDVTT
jgi:hypothetical protein